MFEFLRSVQKEATKIVFPTFDELKRNTIIVVAVCVVSALILWGISELTIEGIRGIYGIK